MKKPFLELNHKFKQLMVEEELFYVKNYSRIAVNTNDNVSLNKLLKFPTLTVIIRCAFQSVYLDECLYQL